MGPETMHPNLDWIKGVSYRGSSADIQIETPCGSNEVVNVSTREAFPDLAAIKLRERKRRMKARR